MPSLVTQCSDSIRAGLCPGSVCACLMAACALAPALDRLQDDLLTYLAQNLHRVLARDANGFAALPELAITQLLLCPNLVGSPVGEVVLEARTQVSIRTE